MSVRRMARSSVTRISSSIGSCQPRKDSQQKFLSAPSGSAVRALRRVLGRGPVDSPSANTGKKEPRSLPPGLDRSLGDELALGCHHSAPSGVACVTRRLITQEVLSNRGVQAVGAYEEVATLFWAARERCPHIPLRLLQAYALLAEVHLAPCLRKPLEQRRLQIRPVQRDAGGSQLLALL